MRRIVLAVTLFCACAVAHADNYRFRGGLVMDGDSVSALLKRGGKPDRIVQLENEYGAGVGERWDYYIDDKVVSFYISGGRVIEISETW